jgi:hypothetical protein
MLNELLGKHVLIEMGVISGTFASGMTDNVKGEIVEINEPWLKVLTKNKKIYVNTTLIKRITPAS